MQFTITDQRPAVLDPIHVVPLKGDYDPMPALRASLVEPLFEPLPGRAVAIRDAKNRSHDQDSILSVFQRTLTGSVDQSAEAGVKSLLSQGLVNYDAKSPLLANELFAIQAGAAHKLPAPSPVVLYSAGSDVIPAAKAMLASPDQHTAAGFFASVAYSYSPDTLGFWFLSESAYEDFRIWFDQEIVAMSAVLPANTTQLLRKFQQLKLSGLTESLILRQNDADQLQEYSFARVLVYLLMTYSGIQRSAQALPSQTAQPVSQTTLEAGVMPFTVGELFLPRTLILANVEMHARSSARKIQSEWQLINLALNAPIKVVNAQTLSKLTALPRAMAKAAAAAATAQTNSAQQAAGRSAKVKFRKQAPSSVDILTGVMRVLKRMKEVNRSQNAIKQVKTSFLRANRRDPSDYNKPGKTVSTHYLPDLHVYVDTSGSISEDNYQQAMLMLIKLAKKLNVNLYFNSFSHVMSEEVLLRTQNKSVPQIWKEFQRIPKVAGGTNYEQIWSYINLNPTRKRRMSLIISDFEWTARSHRVEHPKNLYYAPCGNMDWQRMSRAAKQFVKSAEHLDPAIAQHLIGMVA